MVLKALVFLVLWSWIETLVYSDLPEWDTRKQKAGILRYATCEFQIILHIFMCFLRWDICLRQRLEFSFPLTQANNPNSPTFPMHILYQTNGISGWFQRFYYFYLINQLEQDLKASMNMDVFFLWLSLHPLIHASVLTYLTTLKPELFL